MMRLGTSEIRMRNKRISVEIQMLDGISRFPLGRPKYDPSTQPNVTKHYRATVERPNLYILL